MALPEKEYEERIPALQARLHELHRRCWKREIPSVVVFEGWDAAGKGGAIRRLTPTLDPRACWATQDNAWARYQASGMA